MYNRIILFLFSSFLLVSSSVFAGSDPVIEVKNTTNAPNDIGPYSQVVAFSHYQNISGQLPIDPKTGAIPDNIKDQANQCLSNIKAIVEDIGKTMNDVVRLTVFVKDIDDVEAVDEVYKTFYSTYVPTRTTVVVADLPKDALVQIEALITNGESTIPDGPQAGDLIKLTNNTHNAPTSSLSTQAVAFSHYNNISAQIGVDPTTGRMVTGGVKEQTAQSLKNIKAILASIDVPFDDIVNIKIHLKNLADVDAVNEVYTTFFPDSGIARAVGYFPARTVVAASDLPMHALVQVEAVVSHGDGTPPQLVEDRHGIIIEANNTKKAPISPVSTQTVAFSHYNHISGQLGTNSSGKMVGGGVKGQTAQSIKNIKAIVENIDHSLGDVVKVNIALKNIADIDAVDEVYKEFFPDGVPARTVIGVSDLPNGALVQIDAVVSNGEGTPPVK